METDTRPLSTFPLIGLLDVLGWKRILFSGKPGRCCTDSWPLYLHPLSSGIRTLGRVSVARVGMFVPEENSLFPW